MSANAFSGELRSSSRARIRLFALIHLVLAPAASLAQAPVTDTAWTIRGGSYDSVTVPIRWERATGRRDSRFLRLAGGGGGARVVGWSPARLPVDVAFRRRRAGDISAADSASFWAILRKIESDLGLRVFNPATLESGADPIDAIVVNVRPMPGNDGVTLVTWTSSGVVYDPRVFFRHESLMHNAGVVTHEMMHALGFGHTSAWRSIMNPSDTRLSQLTPEDVAYVQLAFQLRAASERIDMWARLALAVERESTDRQGFDDYAPCAPFSAETIEMGTSARIRGIWWPLELTAIASCGVEAKINRELPAF